MSLLSTALLLTAITPTPEGVGTRESIVSLARDLEAAEERFEASLLDLYGLDVCGSAASFDWDLRCIERCALELEASAPCPETRDALRATVFDQLGYARYRLRQLEAVGIGAQELANTLMRMRAARVRGWGHAALRLHQEKVGPNPLGDEAPILLRRLSAALELERRRAVSGAPESLAKPR